MFNDIDILLDFAAVIALTSQAGLSPCGCGAG
jgi:hypothetical protein